MLEKVGALSIVAAVVLVATSSGCGGGRILKQYEYEEDLHLSLDGSATLYVNASIPALVHLRGLDLDVNPRARVDRAYFRRRYAGAGARVARVSFSRRDGRRFVHLRLDVDDVRRLSEVEPLAWSEYRMAQLDSVVYQQHVGHTAGPRVERVGWEGDELLAFRLHVPSQILFHNAPSGRIERGNILVWEQSLRDRKAARPIAIEVRMETTSILSSTLLLFAASGVAAVLVMAAGIFWAMRRG